MSKYSSLLFTPEEYHHIGPFRFPIYHDLNPGEARGIEKISRKQSKHTYRSIKLAQRIAKDKNISVKEAINLLSANNNDEAQEVLFNYVTELEELQTESVGAYEQQIEFVTLFMQYRAEAKMPDSKGWKKLSDWTTEDTEEMPGKVMREVFDLVLWERDGWPEGNDQSAQEKEKEKVPAQTNS